LPDVARFDAETFLPIVLLAAFLLAASVSVGFRNNFGLGSGWDCSHLPETDPVCVKKPPSW